MPRRPPCQGDPPCKGDPPPRKPPCQGDPPPAKEISSCQGDPPLLRRPPCLGDPPPGPHPGGKLRGIRSRPTPKGEIEGDQIQAHTQGGNSGGSGPGKHPSGNFRGIRTTALPPPHDDYCCGRYASYWNAFLSCLNFLSEENS